MKRLVWTLAAAAALVSAQEKQSAGPMNVELTVYLLSGATQGTADDVPQDLLPTVKQLHSVFAYKSYKLSESFILRARSLGRLGASSEGILPGSSLHYRFVYNRLYVSGEAPRMVHLDGLTLELRRPFATTKDGKQESESLARIYTDLDVREGQKTVVGKSSVSSNGDALILVIVPKVVE